MFSYCFDLRLHFIDFGVKFLPLMLEFVMDKAAQLCTLRELYHVGASYCNSNQVPLSLDFMELIYSLAKSLFVRPRPPQRSF